MVLVRVHSVGSAGRLSLEQDDFILESSSRSITLVEHVLFRKTGSHFCGTCSKRGGRGRVREEPAPAKSHVNDFLGIRMESSAEHDRELKCPVLLKHFHRHAAAVTAHLDVNAGLVELQIAQHHLVQERRQAGIA
jgi:hypothetical protein